MQPSRRSSDKPWDVSVKSLVAFPQILEPMHDKLDWTQKLGDAFLAQQKEVLDAVQRLRVKAQDAGNLKSTEQQKVIVDPAPAGSAQQTIVRIEPANPEVIYVPAYNPATVYGYGAIRRIPRTTRRLIRRTTRVTPSAPASRGASGSPRRAPSSAIATGAAATSTST